MTSVEESTTLEFIHQHLLGDFTSADAFISSLDFGLSQLQNYQVPELYQPHSPVSDPNCRIPEIFGYDVKPEVVELASPSVFISGSKMEQKATPPATTCRKRGKEKRNKSPESDVMSQVSSELASAVVKEEEDKPY
ncbi:hypothetical protein PVK06_037480 [Gossypium arboreum]|uniref:Uncharacterized protein n=1 Tax=Gossypium arboreum TaxID=29729 RepID=A0ABR0MXF6_GOSAR|nr:hypothetical protein PVK06_037480 [Gossypium arboreum]